MRRSLGLMVLGLAIELTGCHHPEITAVSLAPHYCDHKFAFLYDPCREPEGIPFYLPKPLLIVAKNFRNIEDAKVGLTDPAPIPGYFDDQAKYADVNARTNFVGPDSGNTAPGTPAATSPASTFPSQNLAPATQTHIYSATGAPVSPGAVMADGLKPETFYTYQIVFIPDLTQKYGLKIKGGAGEIRAAMNLVNGWQFTGLGPYYMKDSSTAQNILASGITANLAASGVADVVKAAADLRNIAAASPGFAGTPTALSVDSQYVQQLLESLKGYRPNMIKISHFAQISIYEPYLSPAGTMEWRLIADHSYDRDFMEGSVDPAFILKWLCPKGLVDPTAPIVTESITTTLTGTVQGAGRTTPPNGQGCGSSPTPQPGTTTEPATSKEAASPKPKAADSPGEKGKPEGAPPSLLPLLEPIPGPAAPGAPPFPKLQPPIPATSFNPSGTPAGPGESKKVDGDIRLAQNNVSGAPLAANASTAPIEPATPLIRGSALRRTGGALTITGTPGTPASITVPALSAEELALKQAVARQFLNLPPAVAVAGPAAAPNSQVNLNQYFGKPPKPPHPHPGLFHRWHHRRPTVETKQVVGASNGSTVAAGTPPAPEYDSHRLPGRNP
jgi:hypothetical protein